MQAVLTFLSSARGQRWHLDCFWNFEEISCPGCSSKDRFLPRNFISSWRGKFWLSLRSMCGWNNWWAKFFKKTFLLRVFPEFAILKSTIARIPPPLQSPIQFRHSTSRLSSSPLKLSPESSSSSSSKQHLKKSEKLGSFTLTNAISRKKTWQLWMVTGVTGHPKPTINQRQRVPQTWQQYQWLATNLTWD